MNTIQIVTALTDIYNEPLKDEEERKLIFWTDYDKEFVNDFEKIQIDNVKIVHLHEHNQFYIKHLLEEEDTTSSYLIYTNMELDSPDNWLYDTTMYSKTFYADRISLIMNELQIENSLRPIVQQYKKFFDAKERIRRFKAFGIRTYTEEIIELAIMNVICKTRTLDFETVLRTVIMETLEDEKNSYLNDLERFFELNTFWDYVEREYDYKRSEKTLKTLFIHLAVTAFSQSMDEQYLSQFAQFIAEQNKTNALVFIDHWMHHKSDDEIFNEYIKLVESEINLAETINALPIEVFEDADVFPYIDRAVIIYIANSLMENREDYERYLEIISLRRTKHFYEEFRNTYEALYYTVKMYAFHKKYAYGIPLGQAIDLYDAYTQDYYQMDYYYRKFYVAFDAEGSNELLLKLKELVENLYTNWFMGELNAHWSKAVDQEMTNNWTLPSVTNQQKFYSTFIEPHIDKNERAFVIISDAMRYEVGVELQERVNAEIMGDCKIETMLGVVPSITKLGMAALLPQGKLEIDHKGNVLANGQDTSGIENRRKILQSCTVDSVAIHFEDIVNMNKAMRRETCKGKKLIYIYHDTIDAIGDKAATEMDTFNAVEQAMNQLSDLVRIIRNDLSGTHIYITADHGFIYQRDPLEITDLMNKEAIDSMEMKRRYLLSHEQKEVQGQLRVDLSSILKNEEKLFAYVPNATIRYRIQGGGANFVHGGASLQEIVVPVLSIRNKRADQRGAQAVKKVSINLTSTTNRITNSIFSLQFFQNEKVADKMIPRTVVVYMADDKNNILSNEETIIGDLTNDNPKERVFTIQFALKNKQYDRNKTYYLMIKDTETDVIVEKVPFTINLGIISDFDF